MTPRILVIRGGALGDFILTLPAIKLLRDAFPAAHLEILGYKHIVALAEGRFYAQGTRSIEYAAMAGFFVPHSELAPDLAEYFSGFQQVVSYLFDPDGFFRANLRRAGVKHIIQGDPKISDIEHAALQLARPLQQLALFIDNAAPAIYPTPTDRAFADEFLGATTRPIVAIHPGSGSERKNWPIENWAELGRSLQSVQPAATLVLIGGEADSVQVSTLRRAWSPSGVIVAQDLPLPGLAAIIERCTLFIGHDSGISHLAAAVHTPCVLLYGPTDPAIWAPTNPAVTILHSPDGEMNSIPLAEVESAVRGRW